MAPRKLFVEVTTSVHQNDYLPRRLLHERGGSFGVKGILRNKKTGDIVSKPHVHTPDELATDLTNWPDIRTAQEQERQKLFVGDGVGCQLRFEQPYLGF
jgi:hypothetical protein